MLAPKSSGEIRDALAVYGHLLLSSQQIAKAHAVFKGMRVLFPGDAHVARSLAVTTLATGDAAGALALVEQMAPAGPHEAAAVDLVRAKALAALGRWDEAAAVMGRGLARRVADGAAATGAAR